MAVQAQSVTVGTTATLLMGVTQSPKTVVITGHGNNDVYIGGPGVTTASGSNLKDATQWSLRLGQDDSLYAITGTGTHTIQVLAIT
jgi:ATP-dependent protease HslVU (ClpYQ) peptidase subunit